MLPDFLSSLFKRHAERRAELKARRAAIEDSVHSLCDHGRGTIVTFRSCGLDLMGGRFNALIESNNQTMKVRFLQAVTDRQLKDVVATYDAAGAGGDYNCQQLKIAIKAIADATAQYNSDLRNCVWKANPPRRY